MVVVKNQDGRSIRPISRGLLIRGDKILLIQVSDKKGTWWILPGGGQEFGESLQDCLKRECQEELGVRVRVEDCVLVREFIGGSRAAVVGNVADKHFLELYFTISTSEVIDLKPREANHLSLEWVPLRRLREISFFPRVLAARLQATPRLSGAIYVGDAD